MLGKWFDFGIRKCNITNVKFLNQCTFKDILVAFKFKNQIKFRLQQFESFIYLDYFDRAVINSYNTHLKNYYTKNRIDVVQNTYKTENTGRFPAAGVGT